MSIALPAGLPAWRPLEAEGLSVLSREELRRSARRPVRICLVNLMPNKIVTETQIARLLGASAIPVELILCVPDAYRSKTTAAEHMALFYRRWTMIRDEPFDGVIVTGAPLETLRFEEVTYWSDLCAIFDWTRARNLAALFICWAAQAALYHFHAVPKRPLPEKMFGVFPHRTSNPASRLLRGFGDTFPVPVSRHTEIRAADLPPRSGLSVLAVSPEAGLCLIEQRAQRALYMFNHLEYDAGSLRDEFLRDRSAGLPVAIPRHYFPDDDPQRTPLNLWRACGLALFANWLAELQRGPVAQNPIDQWRPAPMACAERPIAAP